MPEKFTARAVGAAAVAAVAVTLIPSPASAIPACRDGHQCSYIFYDNAAHDNIVGGRFEPCDGPGESWGVMSPYLEFSTAQCPE